MPTNEMKELGQHMEKALDHLRNEFQGIRTGRAHPALVEDLKVDYYGTMTPIKQMGTVSVPESRQLLITPWDRTTVKAIEKAILASSLGITPQADAESIRLNMPELTKNRRIELTKVVRKYGEETKVAIRNLRRDSLERFKKLEKGSEITEDDLKRYQKEVQDVTDSYVKKVELVVKEKEEEIMEV